jgi:hypothetical protein
MYIANLYINELNVLNKVTKNDIVSLSPLEYMKPKEVSRVRHTI